MKEKKNLKLHWRWLTSNRGFLVGLPLECYHDCCEEEHSDTLTQRIRLPLPAFSSRMCHRSRGFTLLEVLLAVFIGAIVLTVLYASFFQIINAKESAEDKLELYHDGRVIISKMTEDLSMAYPRGMIYPVQGASASSFFVGKAGGEQGNRSSLDFTSLSHVGGINSGDSDQAEIKYYLKPVPQSDLFFLMRSENSRIGSDSGAIEYPLAERVAGFTLTYMRTDGDEFVNDWDSAQTSSLPKAVDIRLTLRSAKGENFEFNSIVLIPIVN
jgi:general secretion pathway protein J